MVGNVNVKAMELPELVALRDVVNAEITAKEATARVRFLDEMKALAAKQGLNLKDLVEVKRSAVRGAGGKAAPKYRNPQDHSQTWAGRGKRPKWVDEHLNNGGELSALAIESDASVADAPRKAKRKQEG